VRPELVRHHEHTCRPDSGCETCEVIAELVTVSRQLRPRAPVLDFRSPAPENPTPLVACVGWTIHPEAETCEVCRGSYPDARNPADMANQRWAEGTSTAGPLEDRIATLAASEREPLVIGVDLATGQDRTVEASVCLHDTDGDGNCGRMLCPRCGILARGKEG